VRALFSTTPEHSHLAPQLPLAFELQARGHDVLIACSPQLGRFVSDIGLQTAAAGLDLDPDRLMSANLGVSMPPDLTPAERLRWATRAVFAETFAPPMARDLLHIAKEWQPDVMVRDRGEFAGWVVGEAIGAPVATVTFGRVPHPAYDADAAGQALAELRSNHGLDPDPELATMFAGPVFVPAPPSYAEPDISILPTVRFVQPLIHDTTGKEQLPSWVSELGSRPVVYVTLGNIFNDQSMFATFITALAHEPMDVIVTVGRSVDPGVFGAQPANIHIERYVPQSQLLPHVDVVVCHGGFNTVMGALKVGRPLVVSPLSADQPVHAERSRALGVARVLDARALEPAVIRDAVRTVLEDPSYGEAARRVGEEITHLPDLQAATDILEHTVVDRPSG